MPTKKKGKPAPRFTLSERESVLKEALRLIRRPETWNKGSWKCQLFAKNDRGMILFKGDQAVPLKDSRGRQLYSYCLEGAVNQAIYNVLGPIRARALEAYYPNLEDPEDPGEAFSSSKPTEMISIVDLVMEMYPNRGVTLGYDFNDHRSTTHGEVIGVLRRKLRDVRAQLRKRSK